MRQTTSLLLFSLMLGAAPGALMAQEAEQKGPPAQMDEGDEIVVTGAVQRGAVPGDSTMIDALAPALAALPDGVGAAAAAARTGADNNATITKAKAGRPAYLPEQNLKGVNDPGAEAVARLFESLSA